MRWEIVDALPLVILTLLFPDEDFAVVARGCKNIAIFWVCPGYTPYSTFVSGNSRASVSLLLYDFTGRRNGSGDHGGRTLSKSR